MPSDAAISNPGTITEVTFMGGLWSNGNKGGFYFKTTSMPSGIAYFIVRPTDLAIKNFISLILSAKASAMKIQVNYNQVASEGEVVALILP